MPMIDMIKTGENIKNMRIESKVTVRDIVKATGVSERAVFKWQTGETIPTVDNLIVLAKLFNSTMDQIIIVR